jgi:hypothetical protein
MPVANRAIETRMCSVFCLDARKAQSCKLKWLHRGAPPPAHSLLLQNVLDFPQHATYYSAVITKSSKITKNNPDTETYHFRLPKELMQTINRWAERENRTASLQVKEILSRGIRQWYKEQV